MTTCLSDMGAENFQQPADSIGRGGHMECKDFRLYLIDLTREQLMEHFEKRRMKENKEKESDEQ